MEESHWLRLITIGLVLAALAVGYFLISGKFFNQKTAKVSDAKQATQISTPKPAVFGEATQASPSPHSTSSAYNRIASRTRANIQTLPHTGTPVLMTGLLSASAMIVGWGLKKYPH